MSWLIRVLWTSFCSNFFSLTLVPDTELLNPFVFVDDSSVTCSVKVHLARHLDGFRMVTGYQKDQAMIRNCNFNPTFHPLRGAGNWETMDHVSNRSLHKKSLNYRVGRTLQAVHLLHGDRWSSTGDTVTVSFNPNLKCVCSVTLVSGSLWLHGL